MGVECILFGIFLNVYDFAEFAFFRFSRSISFNEEFYITLQHIIAQTKMRCCELFFKAVARRPILVAVCMAIFALFLSMVGMSKFDLSTEVKTGRVRILFDFTPNLSIIHTLTQAIMHTLHNRMNTLPRIRSSRTEMML